ncbi:succinate dehydrogenase/fumarate reductase iron-sulfur subunit [Streptomyces hirsutus]
MSSYQAGFKVWRGDVAGGGLENSGSRCTTARWSSTSSTGSRPPRPRPRRPLELQGGQVRFVLGRDQRPPAAAVHDPDVGVRPGGDDHRDPAAGLPVVRDLVTDVSFNYTKAREVPAFVPPEGVGPGEYRMTQEDVEQSRFRKCIECFLCQDACHVVRDHEENKQAFAGPRFLMRVAELDMHPLDAADESGLDRKRTAQDEHGLGYADITKCCTEVCPEGMTRIAAADNALIPLKERAVDRKYDPLVWLGTKIRRRSAPS